MTTFLCSVRLDENEVHVPALTVSLYGKEKTCSQVIVMLPNKNMVNVFILVLNLFLVLSILWWWTCYWLIGNVAQHSILFHAPGSALCKRGNEKKRAARASSDWSPVDLCNECCGMEQERRAGCRASPQTSKGVYLGDKGKNLLWNNRIHSRAAKFLLV